MTLPALAVLLATVLLLVLYVFGAPRTPFGLAWLAALGFMGWQVATHPEAISTVAIYVVLIALAFTTLVGALVRWLRGGSRPRRRWPRLLFALAALPFLAVPIVEAFVFPFDPEDYRDERWADAFEKLHETLRRRYAFGDWKAIDWDDLVDRHRDDVAQAELAGDERAFYLALRNYLYDLPDGHVSIRSELQDELEASAIGGGFGLALVELDDGRVIAHIVEEGGVAANAGIEWGAEILEWDNETVDQAMDSVPTVWATRPIATLQGRSLAQQQLLPRAPSDTEVSIAFRNEGESETRTATLEARDDGLEIYRKSILADARPAPDEPVTFELSSSGIGYVRIASLEPSSTGVSPPDAMEAAMRELVDGDMKALILDVRGNRGGMDTFVPEMMSYFAEEPMFYETITTYNALLRRFAKLASLHVEPNELVFRGPLVVLIDHRTKSSGEGFALIAKSLPRARIIGFHATDGSFGMSQATVRMPAGITVGFPWGQSLDEGGVVQVDGDHRLFGGVEPDTLVPLTFEHARSLYVDGTDVLRSAATDALQAEGAPR